MTTIPHNPYITGNPVGNSYAFVGRHDILCEVLRVLRRPRDNAVVLYGQRRIGKTSILQHLAAQLPLEGPYCPVYFDLMDRATQPLDRVLQDLARAVAHVLHLPAIDLGPDPEAVFHEKWLPAVLDGLPQRFSLVLLLDEFDVLTDPQAWHAASSFFPYLRRLLASDPQRLQFVFVIGRKVEDLSTIALSLFKGTSAYRISRLNREDTAQLVRLAEHNGTLHWSDEAVDRVWQLTCGHPFLTQQLCSHAWEAIYDGRTERPPTVTLEDVNSVISSALDASRNTLEWLWNGLPAAERMVASALAEAGPGPITQEEIESRLHESGVRTVIRELQNAPRLLQEWGLIESADGGYRFCVELLRRWMSEQKPLTRVQKELDHIEPVAEGLYQAGLRLYQSGKLEQAVDKLKQAISLNPNHVGASQLLSEILLAQGKTVEARHRLERLYEYRPAIARPRLLQALLELTSAVESDAERLMLYEQILDIDPAQPDAAKQYRELRERAEELQTALLQPRDLRTYLRALWRIVTSPGLLWICLRELDGKGKHKLRQVHSSLAITLFFVPLLMIGLLVYMDYSLSNNSSFLSSFYLWITFGLILALIPMSRLIYLDNRYAAGMAIGLIVGMTGGLVFNVGDNETHRLAVDVIIRVIFGIAFGIACGVADGKGFNVAVAVAVALVGGNLLLLLGAEAVQVISKGAFHVIDGKLRSGVTIQDLLLVSIELFRVLTLAATFLVTSSRLYVGKLVPTIVFVLAFIIASFAALLAQEDVKAGRLSRWARGTFGASLLIYILLVCIGFMGYYRLF